MEEEGFAWLHRYCTGKERKAKLALSSLTQPKVHKRETPAHQLCDPDTARTKVGTSSPEEPKKLSPAGPPKQPSHTQKASASAHPANISVSNPAGSCAGRNTKQPAAFFHFITFEPSTSRTRLHSCSRAQI